MKRKRPLTKLRMARMRAYLTQTDLAEMAGVKPKAINRSEILGVKTPRLAAKLAKLLRVDPADILEDKT